MHTEETFRVVSKGKTRRRMDDDTHDGRYRLPSPVKIFFFLSLPFFNMTNLGSVPSFPLFADTDNAAERSTRVSTIVYRDTGTVRIQTPFTVSFSSFLSFADAKRRTRPDRDRSRNFTYSRRDSAAGSNNALLGA